MENCSNKWLPIFIFNKTRDKRILYFQAVTLESERLGSILLTSSVSGWVTHCCSHQHFFCNKSPSNLNGSQTQILGLQVGSGSGSALLSWVQLCLTPAPTLCAGLLYTHFFLELRLSAGVQDDWEKYVMLLQVPAQSCHAITPSHILLVKRNHTVEPKVSGCRNILHLSIGRKWKVPSQRLWIYIHIIRKGQNGPITNTALVYFLPDYFNKVMELRGLLWELSKIMYINYIA